LRIFEEIQSRVAALAEHLRAQAVKDA